jgi:hypothetical protein
MLLLVPSHEENNASEARRKGVVMFEVSDRLGDGRCAQDWGVRRRKRPSR